MKKILILLFTVTLSLSCSNDDDSIQEEKAIVNIRLKNESDLNYKDIVVYNVDYGNLDSGGFSEYKVFEKAYRYANVKLSAQGTEYTLQPYDYVGEEPLKDGNYTYVLTLIEGNVNIELVKE